MLTSQTVHKTSEIQPTNDSSVGDFIVTNYLGLASSLFILFASIYTLKKINQASESNHKKEIKRLLSKIESQKRDSINRYERDIDRLIERVRQVVQCSQSSVESKFLEKLGMVNLAGFGKESKIEDFNEFQLNPIFDSELSKLQEQLRKLGAEFHCVEEKLDKGFGEIIHDLRNNCKRLRVSAPDLNVFRVPQQSTDKFLSSAMMSQKIGVGAVVGIASCATLLGFFPADAVAGTTTDGIGHGVAHGVGHGVAHGVGHGVAHGVGHGVAHGLGFAVPVLNIAIAGFSLYRFGKFLFDDTDAKKDFRNHTLKQINESYRLIMKGRNGDFGLA
jgi:hypothetical protein